MIFKSILGEPKLLDQSTYKEEYSEAKKGIDFISKKYGINSITKSEENKFIIKLGRFNTFKNYDSVFYVNAFCLNNTNRKAFLGIVSINSSFIVSTSKQQRLESRTEWEFIGIFKLPSDFGTINIRPESIADKLIEFVSPVELDFDFDKEFSKKYYFTTDNEENARSKINSNMLNAIKKHKGLEIEIQGNYFLARLKKPVSAKSAKIIGHLLFDLSSDEQNS